LYFQTYVGNILIAVNPFQRVPHLIGEELMQKHKGKNLNEMPPHIFAVGDVAYRYSILLFFFVVVVCTSLAMT
jgi:myosin V